MQCDPCQSGGDALARKRDAGLHAFGARRILGMRVDASTYARAVRAILEMAETGGGTTCVATVHMVMEAYDDPAFQRILSSADLVTSDGMPLVWTLRARGLREAERVYGPDLVPAVCAAAAAHGVPVGLYGGSPDVIARLPQRLALRFPGLRIAFAASPPYREMTPEEDVAVVDAIRDSGVRILFVGLGCPKQELWMAAHREQLSCAMVGVGAAFDFLAGAKRQAPRWAQRVGLEWLFRLACEPRRLWRRYAWHNPRFAWLAGREILRAWMNDLPGQGIRGAGR
ncbi:MAG TPA: WecB/TagA/CpsF family glycosyltransferase [Myxococcota bacterium]|nr:WecB/TagA/CpsF family glycosyltransferase [Myxococcota bacterium]